MMVTFPSKRSSLTVPINVNVKMSMLMSMSMLMETGVRSTGLCLTIQIGQLLFDSYRKLGCLTQIMFDGNLTIVKQKINQNKSGR